MVGIESLVVLAFQSAVFVLFLVAIHRRNVAAAVNGFGMFVLALLPTALDLVAQTRLGSVLPLWIAIAGTLHSLGMLGLYDSTWWWDHLTHTVSAALLAALIYAGAIVSSPLPFGLDDVSGAAAIVTVGLTLALGVFWELFELLAREVGKRFDVPPVLVHYGWRDTALDLVFDLVGALVVVVSGLRVFVPIAEAYPEATGSLLVGTVWGTAFGTVALSLVLVVGRRDGIISR